MDAPVFLQHLVDDLEAASLHSMKSMDMSKLYIKVFFFQQKRFPEPYKTAQPLEAIKKTMNKMKPEPKTRSQPNPITQ